MRVPRWIRREQMTYVASAFVDRMHGRMVNYYRDSDGRYWLAHNADARFRVAVTEALERFEDKDWIAWANLTAPR